MPRDEVPFSTVLELLETYGYKLLRRRKDPDHPDRGFAIFTRPDSPLLGFPVEGKMVAREYYQKIVEAFEDPEDESGT